MSASPGRAGRARASLVRAAPVLLPVLLLLPASGAPSMLDEERILGSAARNVSVNDISSRPLTLVTLRVQQALLGSRPGDDDASPYGFFRLANIGIHAAVAWTLLGLARRVCGSAPAAAAATLWFACHPMHVATVPTLPGRADLGACLFTLLAIRCALRATEQGRTDRGTTAPPDPAWLGLCGLCCLLAVGSKQTGAVAPALVLLCAWRALPASWKRPGALTAAAASIAALLWITNALHGIEEHFRTFGGLGNRQGYAGWILAQSHLAFRYSAWALWPAGVHMDRDPPVPWIPGEPFPPWALLAPALLGACAVAAGRSLRRDSPWGFAFAWSAVATLPTFLIPLGDVAADARAYLAMAGCALALSRGLASLPEDRLARFAVTAIACEALLTLSTSVPTGREVDNPARSVLEAPGKSRAHFFLAHAHARRARRGERPSGEDARDRIEAYLCVRSLHPWTPAALVVEAVTYLAEGVQRSGDEGMAGRALALHPDAPPLRFALARIRLARHDWPGAEEELRRVLALQPDHGEALLTLAMVLDLQDRPEEAQQVLRELQARDPAGTAWRTNYAILLARAGRMSEAEEILRSILAREPGDTESRYNLADILLRSGRAREAQQHLEIAFETTSDPVLRQRIVEGMRRAAAAPAAGE